MQSTSKSVFDEYSHGWYNSQLTEPHSVWSAVGRCSATTQPLSTDGTSVRIGAELRMGCVRSKEKCLSPMTGKVFLGRFDTDCTHCFGRFWSLREGTDSERNRGGTKKQNSRQQCCLRNCWKKNLEEEIFLQKSTLAFSFHFSLFWQKHWLFVVPNRGWVVQLSNQHVII